MNPETIKLLAPPFFFILWFLYALRSKDMYLSGATLFLTSYVACSQNFSLYYREIHQLVQIGLIGVSVCFVLYTGQILRINRIFAWVLGFILLSLLANHIDTDARAQLINFVAAIGVANFLFLLCTDEKRCSDMLKFTIMLACIAAILSVLEFMGAPFTRAEATFANPNYLGYFLGIGFCLAAAMPTFVPRWVSLPLIVAGILATGSRSALLFPALHVACVIFFTGSLRRKILYGAVTGVVIVTLMATNISRFTDVEASQSSDAERIIFSMIAFRMANDNPLFGVGWGRFIAEFENFSSTAEQILTEAGAVDVSRQDRRVTHNDFIRILAELGWVACGLSLLFTSLYLIFIVKNISINQIHLLSLWLGTVAFSLTHNNMNGAMFWFIYLFPLFTLHASYGTYFTFIRNDKVL